MILEHSQSLSHVKPVSERGITKEPSVRSKGSTKASSVGSAKIQAAAKKASLLAEAASMTERRHLETEELLLQQKKRDLDLKVGIAKAEAEKRAYSLLESTSVHDVINAYLERETSAFGDKKLEFITSWRDDVKRSHG